MKSSEGIVRYGMVYKAAERSSKVSAVTLPASLDARISSDNKIKFSH